MKFIGVSGNAGTGKDFITRNFLVPILTNGNSYVIVSFADHFKLESIVKDKLDRNKVYGRKDKETRVILQRKGTEEGREIFGKDLWVNILDERLTQYKERGISYVFVTDCRFPNEIDYIHSKGGVVIRIEASDRHQKAMTVENGNDAVIVNHISETAVSGYNKWDYVIDNSENGSLIEDVKDVCGCILQKWQSETSITVFFDIDSLYKSVDEKDIDYKSAGDKIQTVVAGIRNARLVLVTLGNSRDRVCELYQSGILCSHVNVEIVNAKDTTTYAMLQKKYPSQYYHIIGGNVMLASRLGIRIGYVEVSVY